MNYAAGILLAIAIASVLIALSVILAPRSSR